MTMQLILEEFGPNIQNIAVVENIVADTHSILFSTTINWDDTITIISLSLLNTLFTNVLKKSCDDGYPLDIVVV